MLNSIRIAAVIAGVVIAASLSAQQPPQDYDQGYGDAPPPDQQDQAAPVDPPSRVARLSLIQGPVSFVPAGENDWVEAQINRPLVTGDKLFADNGARAELQVGPAALRVDGGTSVNILNLDDQSAQVEMTQGTINLRVRRLYDGQTYEVDTPTLAFVINRVGEYRVDVAPDGNGAMVTVFHGSGDAYGSGGARFRVAEGQSVRFNEPTLADYQSNQVPGADDFDRFCFDRDGRWDSSPSRQYVSEDVIGYEDLDNNGSWSDEADYGQVWYPSGVATDWTPYSYGSWGWVGAYGWTWVDSSPWGFAPFHYGRWAYVHNRWGWCPGPIHVRPYYAPALVAFVGGGGVRVGFSAGGPVGWFPLGPRDVYVPGYRVSNNYFTRINVYTGLNQVTINNYYGSYSRGNFDYARVNYSNRNIAGAVTAVPGNVFIGARQVRGAALPVTRETFANTHVSGFAAIAPTRQSLAFGGARQVTAPRVVPNRNVIAATRPPAPIAPFSQRETALARDPGRALPTRELRVTNVQGGAPNGGTQAMRGAANPNVKVVTTNGRPATLPAQAITPRTPSGPASNTRNGETVTSGRFGQPGTPNGNPNANASQNNNAMQNGRFGQPGQPNQTNTIRAPGNQTFERRDGGQQPGQPATSPNAAQQTFRSPTVDRAPATTPRNNETQNFRSGTVEHAPTQTLQRAPTGDTQAEGRRIPQSPQGQQEFRSPTTQQFRQPTQQQQQPQVQQQQQQQFRQRETQEFRQPPSQQNQQQFRQPQQTQQEFRQPPAQQNQQQFRQPQQNQQEFRQPPQQNQQQFRQPPPQQQQQPKGDNNQQHERRSRDDDKNGHR